MPSHSARGQDRTQARSMVVSREGIVAAESPLAAQAGAMILASGGDAVDAAVATNAVMGVVEPMMNGIGGDLFAIVFDAQSGKLYGLNASGWAPAKLSIEFLKSKGLPAMPEHGIHSVTVPGAVDGWSNLHSRFGKKKFAEVLAKATEVFGSQQNAEEWLQRPAMGLNDRLPIELLATPTGAKLVEDFLTRLEYGAYT